MPTTIEVPDLRDKSLWVCPNCEEEHEDEPELTRLYECQNDGTVFTRENSADGGSARCPQCNKFASRRDEGVRTMCRCAPVASKKCVRKTHGKPVRTVMRRLTMMKKPTSGTGSQNIG